jgi:hypothetical protein
MWTSVFTAAMALGQEGSHADPAASPGKTCQGTIDSVDANEHVLWVKSPLKHRRVFNLGENCVCAEPGKDNVPASSLRPGEKVRISYQDCQGVLIADRVEQIPLRWEGTITALDATNHTLTLHRLAATKQLRLPVDCQIILRNGESGGWDDVKIGSHVTVTYETPENLPTAREIAQTSQEFAGAVTAIDLDTRTVKAKSLFGAKQFHLADHCGIAINHQPNARLADLRLEDKLVFSYEAINGINVANRIVPEELPLNHVTMSGPLPGF